MQYLINNLLRTAYQQGTSRPGRFIKLLPAHSGPAAFFSYLVHNRRIGWVKFIPCLLRGISDKYMRIDPELYVIHIVPGLFILIAIEVRVRAEACRASAYDGERHRPVSYTH